MIEKSQLLAVYDAALRTSAEMVGCHEVHRLGPLWIGVQPTGDVFVSYAELGLSGPAAAQDLAQELMRFLDELAPGDGAGFEVEVKTRAHDAAPGWEDALRRAGFTAQDPESIMLGPAEALLGATPPPGIALRRAGARIDLMRAAALADRVFGGTRGTDLVPELEQRLAEGDPVQQWIAEEGTSVVSTGRIDPVAGTDVAGLWGGATLPLYRRRGIYRALTSARVAAAMELGVRWIHSDSTEDSRPILERSGLVRIGCTTPFTARVQARA